MSMGKTKRNTGAAGSSSGTSGGAFGDIQLGLPPLPEILRDKKNPFVEKDSVQQDRPWRKMSAKRIRSSVSRLSKPVHTKQHEEYQANLEHILPFAVPYHERVKLKQERMLSQSHHIAPSHRLGSEADLERERRETRAKNTKDVLLSGSKITDAIDRLYRQSLLVKKNRRDHVLKKFLPESYLETHAAEMMFGDCESKPRSHRRADGNAKVLSEEQLEKFLERAYDRPRTKLLEVTKRKYGPDNLPACQSSCGEYDDIFAGKRKQQDAINGEDEASECGRGKRSESAPLQFEKTKIVNQPTVRRVYDEELLRRKKNREMMLEKYASPLPVRKLDAEVLDASIERLYHSYQ